MHQDWTYQVMPGAWNWIIAASKFNAPQGVDREGNSKRQRRRARSVSIIAEQQERCRSNPCTRHETVLRARTRDLLAAQWGIITNSRPLM